MKAFLSKPHIKRILFVKGVVCVGLSANHFLPPEYANAVNWVANIIWLFAF